MGSWIHLVHGRLSPISIHFSAHGNWLPPWPHLLSPLGLEKSRGLGVGFEKSLGLPLAWPEPRWDEGSSQGAGGRVPRSQELLTQGQGRAPTPSCTGLSRLGGGTNCLSEATEHEAIGHKAGVESGGGNSETERAGQALLLSQGQGRTQLQIRYS